MFAGDKNSQKLQRGCAHTHFRGRHTPSPYMIPPYSLIVNIHSQQLLSTNLFSVTYSQYFCRIPTLILHPSPQHLLSDSYSTGHTRLGTFTDLLTQILNIHTHMHTNPNELHKHTLTQQTHINSQYIHRHTNTPSSNTHTLFTHIQSLSHKLYIKTNTRVYTHQPQILWSLVTWSRGRGEGKPLPCIKPRPFQLSLFPGFDPEVSQQRPKFQFD